MKVLQSHVCLSLSVLNAETDLMTLSGKTLTVTSGSSPADASSADSLLCPYVNLLLMNASPAGGFHTTYIYTHTHTHTHTHTLSLTHALTLAHPHAHSLTHAHSHTHTHTRTHRHNSFIHIKMSNQGVACVAAGVPCVVPACVVAGMIDMIEE